jgi:hypothetical protein
MVVIPPPHMFSLTPSSFTSAQLHERNEQDTFVKAATNTAAQ